MGAHVIGHFPQILADHPARAGLFEDHPQILVSLAPIQLLVSRGVIRARLETRRPPAGPLPRVPGAGV